MTKSFAPLSQGGRTWSRAESYQGALRLKGYSVQDSAVQGLKPESRASEVPLSTLFEHLPVAVLRARFEGALKPARKRARP